MLLAIWEDGNWEAPAAVLAILLIAYLLVLWIAAVVWTYRDIIARTGDRVTHGISVALVAIFNLPGLLVYLILRPSETLAAAYDRQLEAEALLHEITDQPACPSCRRNINDDFIMCPYCRTSLRAGCDSCGKGLATTWVLCPYCGTERRPAARPRTIAAVTTDVTPEPATTRQRRASTATYTPPAAAKTSAATEPDSLPDAAAPAPAPSTPG